MKTRTIILISIIFVLTACGGIERDVRKNAECYIKAMAEYDFDAARQYATSETLSTIDYIEKYIMPSVDPEYIASNTPAKIDIDSIVVTADTTATVYFRKTTPIQTNTQAHVNMRLRDGQWLAHQVVDFTFQINTSSQAPADSVRR